MPLSPRSAALPSAATAPPIVIRRWGRKRRATAESDHRPVLHRPRTSRPLASSPLPPAGLRAYVKATDPTGAGGGRGSSSSVPPWMEAPPPSSWRPSAAPLHHRRRLLIPPPVAPLYGATSPLLALCIVDASFCLRLRLDSLPLYSSCRLLSVPALWFLLCRCCFTSAPCCGKGPLANALASTAAGRWPFWTYPSPVAMHTPQICASIGSANLGSRTSIITGSVV
ncbi:hypothetical protein BS78_01G264400 [Paspalum vaginatum]|nr:hypothetical protein BS78_01G264400 [Paspalum vaginatum]KAJ1295987.1 hypothetical protein BS78_01G264400 [Paspalum vaginatum]KAJ1295988.1 hypothetical protein BS78_01G264400 [Paspalum vaginatum]KAJ1295989.1 hypothetical protein BS78_01G264400 [Paspalum vaginatum]KAJ1295990.1 hypothetical protein BS78_01G264400 [Paspalum vaginatum]